MQSFLQTETSSNVSCATIFWYFNEGQGPLEFQVSCKWHDNHSLNQRLLIYLSLFIYLFLFLQEMYVLYTSTWFQHNFKYYKISSMASSFFLSQYVRKNEYQNSCSKFLLCLSKKIILLFHMFGFKYIIFINYKILKEQKLHVRSSMKIIAISAQDLLSLACSFICSFLVMHILHYFT